MAPKKRSADDAALVQAILAEEQAAKAAKKAGAAWVKGRGRGGDGGANRVSSFFRHPLNLPPPLPPQAAPPRPAPAHPAARLPRPRPPPSTSLMWSWPA